MRTLLKKIFLLSVGLFVVFFLSACSQEEGEGSATGGSGGDSPIDEVPEGEVETTGFWINVVTEGQFSVYLKEVGDFDEDCYIESTEDFQVLDCFLDIMELDLYVHDLKIQLNAPPGLCDAVVWSPAWHWNESSGEGPSSITIVDDRNGGQDPQFASCSAVDALGATVACSTHHELTDTSNLLGPTCVYDRSGAEENNCCFGEYTKVLSLDEDEDGTTAGNTVIESTETWGGDPKNCISPYLSTFWDDFTSDGYPTGIVTPVAKDADDQTVGFNDIVFNMPPNGTNFTTGFSYLANFYTESGSPHSHDGYQSATVSNLPYAVDPIDDIDGSAMRRGQEFYSFACLDGAWEVKHVIRLKIREWNTLAEFLAFGTSGGTDVQPDITGEEGDECDYDPIFSTLDCNDQDDFDDILTDAGGSYPTTLGGSAAATSATRRTFFPGSDYSGE